MWLFNDEVITEDTLNNHIGFVYMITRLDTGRRYIGRKLFKFRRTKTVKGKKKKLLIESDWRDYWGSNKTLQEEVKLLGPEKFSRIILKLCKAKGELNYYESWYIFTLGALESDTFYNEWVSCKIHKSHLKKVDFKSA